MKEMRRVLALVLCFVMLVGYVPASAFAAEAETTAPSETVVEAQVTEAAVEVETTEAAQIETTAAAEEEIVTFDMGAISAEAMGMDDGTGIDEAMTEAKTYIDALTINNSSNDPETVVKTFKTHFTWDNEKRENSKSYLFDWSYYNGVVFEGLEYLYEATGDEVYKDYVMEYMSSLINADGTWATCTNSGYTSKQCAGYNATHGADCYKTASLLLDAYEMSGDSRYLTVAATLYADLDTAAASYSLANAGNNFRHTWAEDPSLDLWLDGLYMILPFRAEYAKYIGDTEELDLIVSRMQWVSDNMCDDEGDSDDTGLFYHAANSANSNSKTFWLRSIGWYAAAIVDIMDSMEGENLEAMKAQLVKLVDGMVACQNATNGMWLNNMAASQSSSNPYETSGTALVCYAILKATNNGWLDEAYADDALLALEGICEEKLSNNNLTDICFKGAPGSSNSTFYDNEGKGVGPFIMLYAEAVKHFAEENGGESESEETINTVTYDHANGDAFIASGKGLTAITADVDESADYSKIFDTYDPFAAYAISLEGYTEGETVELTMSVSNVLADNLVVYQVNEDGSVTEITEFTAFAHPEYENVLNVSFDITSTGIYAVGTRLPVIPEGAVLSALEITQEPETYYYFVEEVNKEGILPLNIIGLEVKATYSNGTESVTKRIEWNEFDAAADAYALTCDMTKVGEQDVVVSYTYGDVTLTDTFGIEIVNRFIQDEDVPAVQLELTVPMPVTVEVVENTDEEAVKAALETILSNYISYDFTLTGYTQGDAVKVTLPLPAGEGAGVVYYVPETGAPVQITDVVENENGTITFTTDHFSTYAVGRALPASGTGNLPGGTTVTYVLAESLEDGEEYLIVDTNTAGSGNALGSTTTAVTVTVNSSFVITDAGSAMVWTASGSGSSWSFENTDGRYLGYSTSGNWNSTYSLSVNSSTEREWTVEGSSVYVTTGNFNKTTRYLTPGNTWSLNTASNTDVYFYKRVETTLPGGTVTFTVEPGSANIKTETSQALTGKVTVGGETVDLSNCTITWASKSTGIATVNEEGLVTGVAAGDTSITATLTAVNGTALQSPITLTIPVAVTKVSITNVELASNSGTVYVNSSTGANTGAKVKITYSDGSYEYENVYVNMLSGTYDLTKVDAYSGLKVIYNGAELEGSFVLNVVEKPDMNYPEFPDPGSVFLDKYIADSTQFQNTGVAEINLVTSGLPAHAGVDVILVTDLSNSMAWEVGSRTDAKSFEATKMYDLQQSVTTFAETFLAEENGMPTQNTVSLVTFGGYDADHTTTKMSGYADSCQTLLVGSNSISLVSETIQDIQVLAESVAGVDNASGYVLSFDGGKTYGESYGNTNYDHAFMETYAAVNALKAQYQETNGISYAESGREIYILFMTDGAPSNYDGIYYNYKTGARADVYCTWTNESGEEEQYVMGNNRAQYQAGPWFQYIAGGTYSNGDVPGNPLYWADKVDQMDGVSDIFSIGFDIDNGGFSSMTFTEADGRPLAKVLEHLVTGRSLEVYEAEDASGLQEIYENLASELKLAATNAYFVDQMGDNFSIQMASTVTKFEGTEDEETITLSPPPQITISSYEIYTPDDVNGTTVTQDMIGKRKGTSKTLMETVTFSEDGKKAYSDKIGATTDILGTDGVIDAKYFWYNTNPTAAMIDTNGDGTADYSLPAETFYWNIGTINNQEFVMSYYVYLDGSAEGKKPEGTYATNNFATLYYTNWLGNDAQQGVDSPALAWESAAVYYGFYLVDENGNPVVNRATGETGTFEDAVRVTTKIFYEEVYLNEIDELATIEVASTKVPEGYRVYDTGAKYTLKVNSNLSASGWTIVNTKDPDTTYVTDYKGNEYTKIDDSDKIENKTGYSFTATTVWFAVVWEPTAVPDVVVIDYGLPVDIGVLENDLFGTGGTLIGIGEASKKPTKEVDGKLVAVDGNDHTDVDSTDFTGNQLTLNYGTAKINGAEVRYTPATMAMDSADTFAYEVIFNNTVTQAMEYYYGDVTVIPATIIYYEDTFQQNTSGGITYSVSAGEGWKPVGTEVEDATQQEDRPGQYNLPVIDANNIYGYDAIYADANSSQYSLGSAMKVTVDAGSYADAVFSFCGTGFDIISLTSNTTGVLKVTVTDENGTVVDTVAVDTYYGYAYSEEDGWYPVESEDENAIYQVPVIKLSGMPYGKYTASLRVAYFGPLDHNGLVDGYDFYLDAIRIYNPAGDGTIENDTIQNAYEMDKEGWPLHIKMRTQIIDALDFNTTVGSTGDGSKAAEGIIFIDNVMDTDGKWTYTISDYTNYGPNNELYLAPGQAVAFVLDLSQYIYGSAAGKDLRNIVEDVQVQAKSADGNPVTVTLSNTSLDGTREFKTATSMYYSIKNYMDLGTQKGENADEGKDAKTTLVFENTGSSGIVSFTNIKIVFSENPYGIATGGLFRMSRPVADDILMMMNTPKEELPEVEETEPETTEPEATEPEATEPEETVPEVTEPEETLDADLQVSIRKTSVKIGSTIVVMATTSSDVDALTVNGKEVSRYVESRLTGKRTWTTTVKATEAGDMAIEVAAYSAEGQYLDSITETVTVTGKTAGIVQQIIGSIIGMLFR